MAHVTDKWLVITGISKIKYVMVLTVKATVDQKINKFILIL